MATVDLRVLLMFVLVKPETAPQNHFGTSVKNVYEVKLKFVFLPPALCTILADMNLMQALCHATHPLLIFAFRCNQVKKC